MIPSLKIYYKHKGIGFLVLITTYMDKCFNELHMYDLFVTMRLFMNAGFVLNRGVVVKYSQLKS